MNTRLYQKDFITTPDWTVEDLNTMIDLAFKLKGDFATGVLHDHILRAKTLYMLFFEESTRTRNSFEAGMTQLGGHAIWLTPKATQIGHGENAKDTGMVLRATATASPSATAAPASARSTSTSWRSGPTSRFSRCRMTSITHARPWQTS